MKLKILALGLFLFAFHLVVEAGEQPFPVRLASPAPDPSTPMEVPAVFNLPPTLCFGPNCPLPVADMGPMYLGILHGDVALGEMDQWAYRYQVPGAEAGMGTFQISTPPGTCESIGLIEILGPGRVPVVDCVTLGFPLGAIIIRFDLLPDESSPWVRIWSDCAPGLFEYQTSAVFGSDVLISQGQIIAPRCSP